MKPNDAMTLPSQPPFTCLNSRTIFEICESVLVLETIETLEKGVKYVQSKQ